MKIKLCTIKYIYTYIQVINLFKPDDAKGQYDAAVDYPEAMAKWILERNYRRYDDQHHYLMLQKMEEETEKIAVVFHKAKKN